MSILEYGLAGALVIVILVLVLPKIRNVTSDVKLDCRSDEHHHVVELHQEQGNAFWFKAIVTREIPKVGIERISISKRKTYVVVLVKSNGTYESNLYVKGCAMPIPDVWREFITGFGYPVDGYPSRGELDRLYSYQVRRRANNARARRQQYGQSP